LDPEYKQKIEDKIVNWVDEKNWPTPAWLASDPKAETESYKTYFVRYLRNHYILLEADFRSVLPAYISSRNDNDSILQKSLRLENLDEVTGQIIFDHLQAVRKILELPLKEIDNLMASAELDFLERLMVWINPPHLLSAFIQTLHFRLKVLEPNEKERYNVELNKIIDKYNLDKDASCLIDANIAELYTIRSFLDRLIGACNLKMLDTLIDTGLQIERLKGLRNSGIGMLFILIIFSPFIIKAESGWIDETALASQHFQIIQGNPYLAALLSSVVIVLVGSVGGYLSGLIDIRSSKTDLGKYQESILMIEFLKPLVGGFAALIVYVLLSWDILSPSVEVDNPGIFILIAFISGFSERYFFRLLKLEIEPEQNESKEK